MSRPQSPARARNGALAQPPSPPAAERLESWKSIAAFLGRDVRTVQRWEAREGLPVHRQAHGARGAVYAFTSELEAWRNHSWRAPTAHAGWRKPALVAGAGVAALAIVGTGMFAVWRSRQGARRTLPAAAVARRAPLPFGSRFFAVAASEAGAATTIPVGMPLEQIVASPDGRSVFGISSEEREIVTISTRLRGVARRLSTVGRPKELVLTRDGRRLYVSFADRATIAEVDTASGQMREVGIGGSAYDLMLAPDEARLYAALPYAGLVQLDTVTNTAVLISMPPCPAGLAPTPDRRRLFVAFQCGGPGGSDGHDSIGLFNPSTGALRPFLGQPPFVGGALALTPDQTQLWVGSSGACNLPQYDHRGCPPGPAPPTYVFEAASGRLLATLGPTDGDGGRPVFSPGGDRVLMGGTTLRSPGRHNAFEQLPGLAHPASAWSRDGQTLFLMGVTKPDELAVFAASPPECSPPLDDLLAWWPGDGSGDDAFGLNNGTPSGRVDFAPGIVGQAFRFRRGSIDLGNTDGLDLLAPKRERFTIAAWVKPQVVPGGTQPMLDRFRGRRGWRLQLDAERHLNFCTRDGCISGRSVVPPGQWTHAAAVFRNGNVGLFMNGAWDGGGAIGPGVGEAFGAHTYLGADPHAGLYFHGLLDEVLIYSKNLSGPELSRLVHMPACLRRSSN